MHCRHTFVFPLLYPHPIKQVAVIVVTCVYSITFFYNFRVVVNTYFDIDVVYNIVSIQEKVSRTVGFYLPEDELQACYEVRM